MQLRLFLHVWFLACAGVSAFSLTMMCPTIKMYQTLRREAPLSSTKTEMVRLLTEAKQSLCSFKVRPQSKSIYHSFHQTFLVADWLTNLIITNACSYHIFAYVDCGDIQNAYVNTYENLVDHTIRISFADEPEGRTHRVSPQRVWLALRDNGMPENLKCTTNQVGRLQIKLGSISLDYHDFADFQSLLLSFTVSVHLRSKSFVYPEIDDLD